MVARRGLSRRPGLTLMELVVVLGILIALAAILIPLFPSMIGRAHKASEATNTSELNKAMQLHAGLNNGNFPDGYDLLGDGTNLAAYLPGNALNATAADLATTLGGSLNPTALGAGRLNALNALGITQAWPMFTTTQAEPFTPTFNPYSTAPTTTSPLTATTVVAFVKAASISDAGLVTPTGVNPSSNTQFVLFGVGNRCTMIGNTLASAPHLFPDSNAENPANFYARFGVVFQVEDLAGNPLTLAKFVGAVAIEAAGIDGLDKDLEGYYQKFSK